MPSTKLRIKIHEVIKPVGLKKLVISEFEQTFAYPLQYGHLLRGNFRFVRSEILDILKST
jgi:hypothetical protein